MQRIQILCVLAAVAGCTDETSLCEVGGPCEAYLLRQCECCANSDLVAGASAQRVVQCQEDRRAACETGRLTVSQSAKTCHTNLDATAQYEAAGADFCAELDEADLAKVCLETLSEDAAGAGDASSSAD